MEKDPGIGSEMMAITEPELEAFIMFLRKHKNEIIRCPKARRGYTIGKNEIKIPDNYIEYLIEMKV